MYSILDRYKARKITAKQAFKEIETELKLAKSNKERQLLMTISDQILNQEVPMEERNSEVEKTFWATTKHGEE